MLNNETNREMGNSKTYRVDYTKKIGGSGFILVKAENIKEALNNAKNLCASGAQFKNPIETNDKYIKPRAQGFQGVH